ncbi:hypothetical protein FACS1894122_14480 [Alphaproteobacteria bacterium]|nr:hypothetical protein FACS1894122_14480 [Alphaproteobacteria bacterium]
MKKIAIAFCLLEAAALNAMEGDVLVKLIKLMPEKTQEIRALVGMCDEHYKTIKMRPAFKSIRTAYVTLPVKDMMELVYQRRPFQMINEGRFFEAMKVFKNRLYVAQKAQNVPLAKDAREFIAVANRKMIDRLVISKAEGIKYVDFSSLENLKDLFEASWLGWWKNCILGQMVVGELTKNHQKISIECARFLRQRINDYHYMKKILEITNVDDLKKVENLKVLLIETSDEKERAKLCLDMISKLEKDHQKISVEYAKVLLQYQDVGSTWVLNITNVDDLKKAEDLKVFLKGANEYLPGSVIDRLTKDNQKIDIERAKVLLSSFDDYGHQYQDSGLYGQVLDITNVDLRKAEDLKELFEALQYNRYRLCKPVLDKLRKGHPKEKISIECAKALLQYGHGHEAEIIEITNVDLREPGTFEDLCAAVDDTYSSYRKLNLCGTLAYKLKRDYPEAKIISSEYALYLLRLYNGDYASPGCLKDIVNFDNSDRSKKIEELFEKFNAAREHWRNYWTDDDTPERKAYRAALKELGEPRL